MSEIIFYALAGASELGANAYLIRAGGFRLLLDAGAAEPRRGAKTKTKRPEPDWVQTTPQPHICWISHAHWDHIGALAALKARFPRLSCLSSQPTRALGAHALLARGESAGRSATRGAALAAQLQALKSREYFELADFLSSAERRALLKESGADAPPGLRAMSFPAGHIPGARMLLVEVARPDKAAPFRLLYTGDFCGHDQPLVDGALFPRTGPDFAIDALIMEGVLATQRGADQITYAGELARLVSWLKARGPHPALVGAARLGSAAQIICALLDAGVDFAAHSALQDISDVSFKAAGRRADLAAVEFLDERGLTQALSANRLVIAPGERFERGSPASRLLEKVRGYKNARVAVLNRAYPRSPAGKLLRAAKKKSTELQVERFLLPNHAPRGQLIEAVCALNPARLILVHGHKSQLFALKRALQKAGYTGQVDIPQNGAELVLSPREKID